MAMLPGRFPTVVLIFSPPQTVEDLFQVLSVGELRLPAPWSLREHLLPEVGTERYLLSTSKDVRWCF